MRVFQKDCPNPARYAQAYLQFIVDFYDRLPAAMVFLHAHRSAWHRGDALRLLPRLRWGGAPYANLRYQARYYRGAGLTSELDTHDSCSASAAWQGL